MCIIDRKKIEDCFFAGFKLDFGTISVYLYGYLTVFIQKNAWLAVFVNKMNTWNWGEIVFPVCVYKICDDHNSK